MSEGLSGLGPEAPTEAALHLPPQPSPVSPVRLHESALKKGVGGRTLRSPARWHHCFCLCCSSK